MLSWLCLFQGMGTEQLVRQGPLTLVSGCIKWGEYHQFLPNVDAETKAVNRHEVPTCLAASKPSVSMRLSNKANVRPLDDGALDVDSVAVSSLHLHCWFTHLSWKEER